MRISVQRRFGIGAVAKGLAGLFLATAVTSIAISGCDLLGSDPKGATLVLSLSGRLTAKTIQPEDFSMEVAYYTVEGDGPADAAFSDPEVTGTTVVRSSLVPGEWTITVEAYNADDIQIGEGEVTVTVGAGEVLQVTVPVTPLPGVGVLDLAVSWPEGVLTNAALQSTLVPVGATPDPDVHSIDFESESPDEQGTVQVGYRNEEQETGYYTLSLTLLDEGTTPVWGTVQAVRIIFGRESSETFALVRESNRSGMQITINPELDNPFDISLSVDDGATYAEGTDVVVTGAADGQSIDEWRWYLQGALLDNQDDNVTIVNDGEQSTVTIGALPSAYYRLNVVAESGDVLSSATLQFEVEMGSP